MSRQYHNVQRRLEDYGASVITSLEDYIHEKETEKYPEFEIKCQRDHIFTMKVTSLFNKFDKMKKDNSDICAECEKPEISGEERRVRERCEELGFNFVSFKDRQVEYVCKCGNKTRTHATNLTRERRKPQCPKCQNGKRYSEDNVPELFEKAGCKLLSKYKTRFEPVKFKCECGRTGKIRFVDFIRGYRCEQCNEHLACEHKRIKTSCIICNGRACPHNRDKQYCVDCGDGFCEHGIHKGYCKDCGGKRYCEHDMQRKMCLDCNSARACVVCFAIYAPQKFYPYCTRCYYIINSGITVPRRYKLKEHYMRDVLIENFDIKMVFDRIIGGCSGRRPDVFIEQYTHGIVIECDEYQHKNYSCENKRMMEIFQDIGNRPLVIIRFNPDSYTDAHGVYRESCFTVGNYGEYSVDKKEWSRRTKRLINLLNKYITTQPTKEITIYRLFYNGYKY